MNECWWWEMEGWKSEVSVTWGCSCYCSWLAGCGRLLTELPLGLQHRVLKLGSLIDVAASKQDTPWKRSRLKQYDQKKSMKFALCRASELVNGAYLHAIPPKLYTSYRQCWRRYVNSVLLSHGSKLILQTTASFVCPNRFSNVFHILDVSWINEEKEEFWHIMIHLTF